VQLPGRENRISESPYTELAKLVDVLSAAVRPYLDRPFAIYGHSMGALFGFELARRLRREYHLTPEHLFVAGYFAPHVPSPLATRRPWLDGELMHAVRHLLDAPEALLSNAEFMQALLPTIRADLALVGSYHYTQERPLECPITAFGGLDDSEVRQDDLAAWSEHAAGEFRLQMFPGAHLFLLSDRDALLAAVSAGLALALDQPSVSRGQDHDVVVRNSPSLLTQPPA
jgi:surfactin synthase thioesterase subunit